MALLRFITRSSIVRVLMITLTTLSVAVGLAQPKLPRIFSDHMVLQRDQPVRFWGSGVSLQTVEVEVDGFTVRTRADDAGNWEVLYPAHAAGGPYEVKITAESEVMFQDVWFGDVWVASGQSNMEWKLGWKVNNWEQEVKDSDYPQIRFFEIRPEFALVPQDALQSGQWVISSPATAAEFSAVAWFFAKHNHQEKKVPVGIISSSWGGTPAEAWASARRLVEVPGYEAAAKEILNPEIDWEQRRRQNEELSQRKWQLIGDKESFLKLRAHFPDYDDSAWEVITLPNSQPLHDFVWVRKSFELKSAKSAKLYLGDINQICTIFLNGQVIGEESWQDATSVIAIPDGIAVKGTNLLTIRAVNSWDNNVSIGRPGEMWIETGGKRTSLEGAWKYTNSLEPEMPEVEFFHWRPGLIYNQMIHPIGGYGIRGAIWYQGESNADKPHLYNELFETMIEDWRIRWRQGDFPFLFVQLASYMERKQEPTESQWAELREAQAQTLALPNTGMAVTIDVGDARDIHPRNKQDVGKRLWLAARKVSFGEDVVYSGPKYVSHEVIDNRVFVTFDHTGGGLKSKGSELKGFAIAGKEGKFYWAKAEIRDGKVEVWSDRVQEPAFVRYAWGDNPECTLYNVEGLPAAPFRVDL